MNWDNYKQRFELECKIKNIPSQIIESWIKYAKIIYDNGYPIIYDKNHLSLLFGLNNRFIDKIIHCPHKFYRSFSIKKRNGSERLLNAPYPSLMKIQQWILNNILKKKKISPYAKAYIPNLKITENARFHTNHKIVLKFDINDFFGSIHKKAIIKIFMKMGYEKSLSYILASFCCLNNALPQGAPTSPYLSNIFFEKIDSRLSKYLKKINACYTRYSDDITISGNISDNQISHIMAFLKYLLSIYKLNINESKTKVLRQNQKQYITGMVVNKKISADAKLKHNLRQQMYYIQKYGLDSHMFHKNINDQNYIYRLLGQIQWVIFLEKKNKEFQNYKIYLMEILK